MTDREVEINLNNIVCDDNNQKRKSWVCFGQTCSRSLIGFLSQLFVILLNIFDCFRRIYISKACDEPLFGWEFSVVQQDTFYLDQDYEQVNFYKVPSLYCW